MIKRKLESLCNFADKFEDDIRDVWTELDRLFYKIDKRYQLKKFDPDEQEEADILLEIVSAFIPSREAIGKSTKKITKIEEALWEELDAR